jgi:Bacterial Ig-like domain (group 3)
VHQYLTPVVALAAALALTPLVGAAQATATDPPAGTLTVSMVDDHGRPVVFAGSVARGAGAVELVAGPAYFGSTVSTKLPPGTYGIAALGGWGGLVCQGFSSCTPDFGTAPLTADAVKVTDGGTIAVTLTAPTPTVAGPASVGKPLSVVVPSGLTTLGAAIVAFVGGEPAGFAPSVAWRRDGVSTGASGLTYTPTIRDAGHTVTAVVSYPPRLTGYLMLLGGTALVPPPVTTAGLAVPKLAPAISLDVPQRFVPGKRPTVFVEIDHRAGPATGTVNLAISGARPMTAALRSGLARFRLPRLSPGKHRLTVTYPGTAEFEPVGTAATVIVTRKPGKHRH